MKKELKKSEAVESDQKSADYEFGQVSGSLFPTPPAGSGSLSALFSSAAPAPLLFIPAPKPAEKIPGVKKQTEPAGVKAPALQHQKKSQDEPADCQQLVDRESALQNADQQEQQKKPSKANRRKAAVALGMDEEEAVQPAKRPRNPPSASHEEDEEKKKRTVFVGNLPASFTKKGLLKLFREKGAVESTRFRSVVREDPSDSLRVATIQRKVHPMKQSLNAYVVFKDEEGACKALERNGLEVAKDFVIRVDSVTDSTHDHKRSVFVGNLAFELTEATLREHFEGCGAVTAVRLIRDKNTGLGKGFGYILFESADSVQLALKLDGTPLATRKVRVKRSVKKDKKVTPSGAAAGGGAKKGSTGPGRGGGAKERPAPGKGVNAAAFQRRVARKPAKPSSFRGEMTDSTKTKNKSKTKSKKKFQKIKGTKTKGQKPKGEKPKGEKPKGPKPKAQKPKGHKTKGQKTKAQK
ncbi:RNA-binding protein 34 [Gadus chalcogrammus]|uniref:RNA-binding protein 34 n=1 Tax=Gadus chalcogrammus TaxID=1042646 RepID=UPI0024C3675E|nr:RNA-binding protein 34 [Gadus chalcogrammus]